MSRLHSLPYEAFTSAKLSTTQSGWNYISQLPDLVGRMVMIASSDLIDPITNPDGVSIGYYNPEDREFIVAAWDRETAEVSNVKIPLNRVTHFILIKGPY